MKGGGEPESVSKILRMPFRKGGDKNDRSSISREPAN